MVISYKRKLISLKNYLIQPAYYLKYFSKNIKVHSNKMIPKCTPIFTELINIMCIISENVYVHINTYYLISTNIFNFTKSILNVFRKVV